MLTIDERLSGPLRSPRTHPRSLLLGPTGRRLWADMIDDVPGFRGTFDYIHKLNIPLLFSVGVDSGAVPERSEGIWHPSHLVTHSRFREATVDETRFITWSDEAISLQHWRNHGDRPITVTAEFDEGWCRIVSDRVIGTMRVPDHGYTLSMTVRAHPSEVWQGITLASGEELDVQIVAALRHESWDDADPSVDAATTWHPDEHGLLERQRADYQRWFDAVPDLESDSEILQRTWAYRWYILRSTLAEPELGRLRSPVFYEGRSHKTVKTPWRPSGWEFSKLIPLSTPFHVIDLRWRQDADFVCEVLAGMIAAQGDDGQLWATTARQRLKPYASFYGHAVAQFGRVHGYSNVPDSAVAMARRQVLGERRELEASQDELPVQRDHKLTGKEYQPSYWAFHDFPADPADEATFTPLKRVDRAVYQHLNARGVAEMSSARGEPDTVMEHIAQTTAESVRERMWSDELRFFVDLRVSDDAHAQVRNVVGFYPWWAGIATGDHLEGLRAALSTEVFATMLPYPSTAADEPAFRAQGGWMGQLLKGRNGCMWNGPSWPYTTGIALESIAKAALDSGDEALEAEFRRGALSYLRSHFRDGDLRTPYLVEHYDPLTGEPLSDEADYSHSSVIDLVVRRVVGLEPADGQWLLRPFDVGAAGVRLSGVPVGNHVVSVDITWGGDGARAVVHCRCGTWFDGVVDPSGVVLDRANDPCA